MRMWQIDPRLLCRKHLLGCHGELHKHRPSFVKRHSVAGRLSPVVQIEPISMERRHNDLAAEMIRRGYKHNSPYAQPDISHIPAEQRLLRVDVNLSIQELSRRCPECRERILQNQPAIDNELILPESLEITE